MCPFGQKCMTMGKPFRTVHFWIYSHSKAGGFNPSEG